MLVSDKLEDKFENELLDFLNQFQEENDCKIKFWSWTPDGMGNFNLKIEIEKTEAKYFS